MVQCKCDNPAVLKQVKVGANSGKSFYSCPNYVNQDAKGCGYFKWASEMLNSDKSEQTRKRATPEDTDASYADPRKRRETDIETIAMNVEMILRYVIRMSEKGSQDVLAKPIPWKPKPPTENYASTPVERPHSRRSCFPEDEFEDVNPY